MISALGQQETSNKEPTILPRPFILIVSTSYSSSAVCERARRSLQEKCLQSRNDHEQEERTDKHSADDHGRERTLHLAAIPIPWFRHGTVPSDLSSRNLLCAELVEGHCPKPGTRGHRFSEPASDNWRRVSTPSLWTDEVWDGSLATMLCEWLSKPETFQPLYTIFVQGDAGTRRAVLDHRDMEALVKRADFPAKRLAAA